MISVGRYEYKTVVQKQVGNMIYSVGDIVEAVGDTWPKCSLGAKGIITELRETRCSVKLLEPQQTLDGKPVNVGYVWDLTYRNWRPIKSLMPMTCVSLL